MSVVAPDESQSCFAPFSLPRSFVRSTAVAPMLSDAGPRCLDSASVLETIRLPPPVTHVRAPSTRTGSTATLTIPTREAVSEHPTCWTIHTSENAIDLIAGFPVDTALRRSSAALIPRRVTDRSGFQARIPITSPRHRSESTRPILKANFDRRLNSCRTAFQNAKMVALGQST